MTRTAALMSVMMQIADQIEDLEVQIDYVRKTTGNPALIAKLQNHMQECMRSLESVWDSWNEELLKERLAMV